MEAYAVVETGSKQFLVKAGDCLKVEKLEGKAGDKVTLDRVLAVSDGKALKIGTPMIAGAVVKAEIVDQVRAPKVISFKKKRRKGYSRKVGHRQDLTVLKVSGIG